MRSRAWSDEELDAAEERLIARGLVADGGFTDEGRAARGCRDRHEDDGGQEESDRNRQDGIANARPPRPLRGCGR